MDPTGLWKDLINQYCLQIESLSLRLDMVASQYLTLRDGEEPDEDKLNEYLMSLSPLKPATPGKATREATTHEIFSHWYQYSGITNDHHCTKVWVPTSAIFISVLRFAFLAGYKTNHLTSTGLGMFLASHGFQSEYRKPIGRGGGRRGFLYPAHLVFYYKGNYQVATVPSKQMRSQHGNAARSARVSESHNPEIGGVDSPN